MAYRKEEVAFLSDLKKSEYPATIMMKLYSNEIVFKGHPDKVCDQISDALLDAYLEQDKDSRCGIEVVGGKGKIFVTGEVTSNAKVNVADVVNYVLDDVSTDLTSQNIASERYFKRSVLEWLNNGYPKLFRHSSCYGYTARVVYVL